MKSNVVIMKDYGLVFSREFRAIFGHHSLQCNEQLSNAFPSNGFIIQQALLIPLNTFSFAVDLAGRPDFTNDFLRLRL